MIKGKDILFISFFLMIMSWNLMAADTGKYDAIQNESKLLNAFSQAKGLKGRLEAMAELGRLTRYFTGNYKMADSLCSMVINEAGDDSMQLLEAYNIYFESKDPEDVSSKVMHYANDAENICMQYKENMLAWRTWSNLTDIYLAAKQNSHATVCAYNALSLAYQHHDTSQQSGSYLLTGKCLDAKGQKIEAFRSYLKALNIAAYPENKKLIADCYKHLASFYEKNKLFDKAHHYKQKQGEIILEAAPLDSLLYMWILFDLNEIDFTSKSKAVGESSISQILAFANANHLLLLKNYTISLYRSYLISNDRLEELYEWYRKKYADEFLSLEHRDTLLYTRLKAYFYEVEHKTDSADLYFRKAAGMMQTNPNKILLANFYIRYGQFLKRHNKREQAIHAFKEAYRIAGLVPYNEFMLDASRELEALYSGMHDFENAYWYGARNKALGDSIYNDERRKKITELQMQFESDKKQQNDSIEHAHQNKLIEVKLQKQKSLTFSVFMALAMAAVILFFVFKNYRDQKRANQLIRERQQQLIQQEKLASLGQMTAGIAHEISNPLNFINNFSTLTLDLFHDLKSSESKSQTEELFNTIESNLVKIEKHGRRAGNIVKSMLDHSRNTTGEKQQVDFNVLCDRTMNLVYQSMLARFPGFRCELKKNLQVMNKVQIRSLDFSRALINLLNNAFYYVYQELKKDPAFNPVVELSAVVRDKRLFITVHDNGPGVPEAIRDKIFQPFFTTRPTGEGSGLGLSLSYDIVVSLGGTLYLENTGEKNSMFVISLPV